MRREALIAGAVLFRLGRQIDVGLHVAGEDFLQRPAEFAQVEHRIVELRQDDRRSAQIFLGDGGAADAAVLVDIIVALDPVLVVGEVDHPLAQVGAVDEMVEHVERQQIGIAIGLVADVDQRLALVIAVEELVLADRGDQEAERVLLPARRGRRARDRSSALSRATPLPSFSSLPKERRLYRAAAGSGSAYLKAAGQGGGADRSDRVRARSRAAAAWRWPARSAGVARAARERRRARRARPRPAGVRAARSGDRSGASGITARLLPARSAAGAATSTSVGQHEGWRAGIEQDGKGSAYGAFRQGRIRRLSFTLFAQQSSRTFQKR